MLFLYFHFKSYKSQISTTIGYNSIHKFSKINLNFDYVFFIQRLVIFVYLHSFYSLKYIYNMYNISMYLNNQVTLWLCILRTQWFGGMMNGSIKKAHRQNKKINMCLHLSGVCRKLEKKEYRKKLYTNQFPFVTTKIT